MCKPSSRPNGPLAVGGPGKAMGSAPGSGSRSASQGTVCSRRRTSARWDSGTDSEPGTRSRRQSIAGASPQRRCKAAWQAGHASTCVSTAALWFSVNCLSRKRRSCGSEGQGLMGMLLVGMTVRNSAQQRFPLTPDPSPRLRNTVRHTSCSGGREGPYSFLPVFRRFS